MPRISFTASRPELPSASWMSARISPGCELGDRRHSFLVGAGDVDHVVPEILDQRLKVQCDQRFVLDDENVRLDLLGDFAAGIFDQTDSLRSANNPAPAQLPNCSVLPAIGEGTQSASVAQSRPGCAGHPLRQEAGTDRAARLSELSARLPKGFCRGTSVTSLSGFMRDGSATMLSRAA